MRNSKTVRRFALYKADGGDVNLKVFISAYFTIDALKVDAKRFAEQLLGAPVDYMSFQKTSPSTYTVRFGSKTQFIVIEETTTFFFNVAEDDVNE